MKNTTTATAQQVALIESLARQLGQNPPAMVAIYDTRVAEIVIEAMQKELAAKGQR